MPRKKRFYFEREHSFQSDLNPDDDLKDDELELLEEVPYSSSSSADRSSIGSIPWADDAIKQNQTDWERVERMLCGEEALPENEPELRNEILEWQSKFSHLLSPSNKEHIKEKIFESTVDTLELDSISNLSLNSLVEDDYNASNGERITDKSKRDAAFQNRQKLFSPPANKSSQQSDLAQFFGCGLHISSVRPALRQRQATNATNHSVEFKSSDSDFSATSSVSTPVPHATQSSSQYPAPLQLDAPTSTSLTPQRCAATALHSRPLRVPPVLNVLETKRRFQELINHRSFVQLTQVQQVKSAAVDMSHSRPPALRRNGLGNQSAWHPLAAVTTASNRFRNNRNAIILPAIDLQRFQDNRTISMAREGLHDSSKTTGNSYEFTSKRHHILPRQNLKYSPSTISTATPSTGRSISAATHNLRGELRAIYLPYSASKF